MKRFVILISILMAFSLIASAWTPSVVLEPNHPRILFTSSDSADIASRLHEPPFDGYYSSIWSNANATSGNSTQVEDFTRSKITMCAAFVLYFGVQPSGDTLTTTQRTDLETKAIDYINNMLTDLEGTVFENSAYHRPCERLIQYCCAYDILQGAGISVSSSRIEDLANTIYDGATTWAFGYVVDNISLFMNHKLIVAGALGCAAVTKPSEGGDWIEYAMTKTNKVTFQDESDSTSITGFAEGPHYFKYAMEHLLQFFMGMKHYCGDIVDYYADPCGGEESGAIRTFWYHEGWDSIYAWISAIRLPDGTMPPLDDTFRHDGLCHTAPFAERDPSFYWGFSGGGSRMYLYPMLVAVGAEPGPEIEAGMTSLPEAGNLIFRGNTDNGSVYFHFLAEHGIANTSTHNQADEASFFINAYGEDIALDPGYIQYSERDRVNASINHNMILVNGSGTSTLSPVDSYIDKYFEIPGFYYGEVSTSYLSTDIHRRSALLNDKFCIVIDDLRRSSSADYTFQCHGDGLLSSGTFVSTGVGGIWTGTDSAAMELVIDAIGGSDEIAIETDVHETGYLAWAEHSVVRCRKNASNTKFAALIYPYLQSETGMLSSVHRIDGQATIRFAALNGEGVIFAKTDPDEISFPGDSGVPNVYGASEGAFMFFDSDSQLSILYTFGCDSLLIGDAWALHGDSGPVDIALNYIAPDTIVGYLNSDAATIVLTCDEPSDVIGATTWSWASGTLTFSQPPHSHFKIVLDPLKAPDEKTLIPYSISISAWPNPFNSSVNINIDASLGAYCNMPMRIGIYNLAGHLIQPLTELDFVIPRAEAQRASPVNPPSKSSGSNYIWHPAASLPSGVYLVRANFDNREVTKRIVYMK